MPKSELLTPGYWQKFKPTKAEVDQVFSWFLEDERPMTVREIAQRLVEGRLRAEQGRQAELARRGNVFQPKNAYKVGQELMFPALDYAVGQVVATREGANPEYGAFTVIEVQFTEADRREFASMLTTPHALSTSDQDGGSAIPSTLPITIDQIMEEYGESVTEGVEAELVDQDDAVSFGEYWFTNSLLVDVDVAQLHLSEALLEMAEGGPMRPAELLENLDFAAEVSEPIREFSLNVELNNDRRFDDVGAAGQTLWFLRQMEPPEALDTPPRLEYNPMEFDSSILTEELRTFIREIDDEYSDLEEPEVVPAQTTITLIYPHRRMGTMPLTSHLRAMLPKGYESPRIRVTLIDKQDNQEFAGWVVHESRYMCGLFSFYKKHRMPIGGYITVRGTDDPTRFVLDFPAYKPRTEHVRLAVPKQNRLTFELFKRQIGATYDELSLFGAEDVEGVDTLWKMTQDRRRGLAEVMKDLIPELARFNANNAVHAKTLYGAVNILRRAAPEPIFATLVTRDDFAHAGGPYWRLR